MVRATLFILYRNYYLLVYSIISLSLLIKTLVNNNIFEFEVGRDIIKTEFDNLFTYRLDKIKFKNLLKKN